MNPDLGFRRLVIVLQTIIALSMSIPSGLYTGWRVYEKCPHDLFIVELLHIGPEIKRSNPESLNRFADLVKPEREPLIWCTFSRRQLALYYGVLAAVITFCVISLLVHFVYKTVRWIALGFCTPSNLEQNRKVRL